MVGRVGPQKTSLKSALTFGVTRLKVVGDSKLVISQVVGEWKTRDSKWIPYQELAERPVSLFDEVVFVSRILVNVVVVKMEGSQRGQQAVADQGAAIGSAGNNDDDRQNESRRRRRERRNLLQNRRRGEQWNHLRTVSHLEPFPWVFGGDFNTKLSLEEKSGGALSVTASIKEFQDAVNDCNLIDLGISEAKFTWSKRSPRNGFSHLACKFDRFLVSTEWNLMFRSSEEPFGMLRPQTYCFGLSLLLQIDPATATLSLRKDVAGSSIAGSSHKGCLDL